MAQPPLHAEHVVLRPLSPTPSRTTKRPMRLVRVQESKFSLFLRAGFQREGLLRGNWKTHLGVRDSVILAKLRP